MSRKPKMTRDSVPEGFSLPLVIVDALPVLFFGGSMILIGLLFDRTLFQFGALLCLWAGTAKVLWKILVVTRKRNVWWLFLQMRTVMPIGFALLLLSVILNRETIALPSIQAAVLSAPSVILFAVGAAGMLLMGVFAAVLDPADVRSNWIEQLTNTAAQAAIFFGILLLF